MTVAMLCAAAVTAQFVGGKATRDALFFTSHDITTLPAMLVATAICSLLLVAANSLASRRFTPATIVPASFVISGLLFLVEFATRADAPATTSILLYLHVSGAGPLFASGFWLITSERFNPRTAKKGFGRVAAAGTVGGLVGALISERVAALFGGPSMLLVLALLQFVAAVLARMLARSGPAPAVSAATSVPEPHGGSLRSGVRVIAEAPYLRVLVALVLLGTTSAALLDYVFKASAVQRFGPGDGLLRFFALYYAGSSLISFALQMFSSRVALERFGLGLTASTPSIALIAGSLGSLIAPGFGSLLVARGAETIFRSTWFKAGYELFYTPIPAAEKRAAKSVIDVGADRLGDAFGAALVRGVILLAPAAQATTAMLGIATIASAGAILAASRLNRWYRRTLETSLVDQAAGIDLSKTVDGVTATVLLDVQARASARTQTVDAPPALSAVLPGSVAADPDVRDILALRSRNRVSQVRVLSKTDGISRALVPHVIPLLAADAIADYALFALRKVAEEHVGALTDALLDRNQPYEVRRRLARVFSIAVSQRAADGLMLALEDSRFDVRFQTARSLAAIIDRNPRVRIDAERIYEVVMAEVAVSRPVWESQRLMDGFVSTSPLDEFVRDRADQSLAHVFTLLSLVLPREPLQIAFRSLHSDDKRLRGTALEYLESVLPAHIKQRLWPFLVTPRSKPAVADRQDAISALLRSSSSVTLQRILADGPAKAGPYVRGERLQTAQRPPVAGSDVN